MLIYIDGFVLIDVLARPVDSPSELVILIQTSHSVSELAFLIQTSRSVSEEIKGM